MHNSFKSSALVNNLWEEKLKEFISITKQEDKKPEIKTHYETKSFFNKTITLSK